MAIVECGMFWLTSLFLFLCGSAAFTLKLVTAAAGLMSPDVGVWSSVLQILQFLNQVLGIMQIQFLLRWRLFRFVFGGQDVDVSIEEKLVEHIVKDGISAVHA